MFYADHFFPILARGLFPNLLVKALTQEDRKSSQHGWKIVDLDIKHQYKQKNYIFEKGEVGPSEFEGSIKILKQLTRFDKVQ